MLRGFPNPDEVQSERTRESGDYYEEIFYSTTGDVVETIKTQTLSNKTLMFPSVNGVVAGGVSSLSGLIVSDLNQTSQEYKEEIFYPVFEVTTELSKAAQDYYEVIVY